MTDVMIDHIGISVSDYDRMRTFYDRALAPLGMSAMMEFPLGGGVRTAGYGKGKPIFWVTGGARTIPHAHVAFQAASRAEVDAFHAAAIAAGARDNGAPGIRPHYHETYYGAFVLDPDGHNIEAVCHLPE